MQAHGLRGVQLIGGPEALRDISTQALVDALVSRCEHLVLMGKLKGVEQLAQSFQGHPMIMEGMCVELIRTIQDNLRAAGRDTPTGGLVP